MSIIAEKGCGFYNWALMAVSEWWRKAHIKIDAQKQHCLITCQTGTHHAKSDLFSVLWKEETDSQFSGGSSGSQKGRCNKLYSRQRGQGSSAHRLI